jgi:hypothetical protein
MRDGVKITFGFMAGVAVASGAFLWLIRPKFENHVFDHGFHDGYFCGQEDIFEHIASEFGWRDYTDSDGYHPLLELGGRSGSTA